MDLYNFVKLLLRILRIARKTYFKVLTCNTYENLSSITHKMPRILVESFVWPFAICGMGRTYTSSIPQASKQASNQANVPNIEPLNEHAIPRESGRSVLWKAETRQLCIKT